ncbi:MAG: hypothetical protein JOS17DRAFT_756870 [Linnemannia elongata]|nr:MAG: hypothetical protein JOS17DRAFT_756870 [Linnemannia elongata]
MNKKTKRAKAISMRTSKKELRGCLSTKLFGQRARNTPWTHCPFPASNAMPSFFFFPLFSSLCMLLLHTALTSTHGCEMLRAQNLSDSSLLLSFSFSPYFATKKKSILLRDMKEANPVFCGIHSPPPPPPPPSSSFTHTPFLSSFIKKSYHEKQ